jgi:branched-chain amino acid transport system permease protein
MNFVALGQAMWYGTVNGAGYVLFSSGLALVFGIMKVINIAHGELFMLGAVSMFALAHYTGMNIFGASLLAVVGVAAIGIAINRAVVQPTFKVSQLAPLLATLGLSLIMQYGTFTIFGPYARLAPQPFVGVNNVYGIAIGHVPLMIVITSVVVVILLQIFLAKTRWGKEMRATVQNLTGANLVGINTKRVYDLTFALASGLAALGGILLGIFHTVVPSMGQPMLITGFVIIIVAGMGNLVGAAIVGFIVGIVESLLIAYTWPAYTPAFIYLILVAVLLIRPQGLFGAKSAN